MHQGCLCIVFLFCFYYCKFSSDYCMKCDHWGCLVVIFILCLVKAIVAFQKHLDFLS